MSESYYLINNNNNDKPQFWEILIFFHFSIFCNQQQGYYIIQMLKQIIKFLLILALLIIGILYIIFSPSYSTQIIYQDTVVDITRDEYNIPYIIAPTHKSFFYAWGQVIAEDRLFQISFKQLAIQGRLSQFLGERTLGTDKFMRELNLYSWGQRMSHRLYNQNHTDYQHFKAFVDGINDKANSLVTLPIDFHLIGLKWENWTVANVMAMYKLMQWSQSSTLIDELTRSFLLPNFTKQQIDKFMPNHKSLWSFNSTVIVDDRDIPQRLTSQVINKQKSDSEAIFNPLPVDLIIQKGWFNYLGSTQGSNSWVISGEHTQSGQPILVNDPHLSNSLPSQWYQLRGKYYVGQKSYELKGVAMPGVLLFFGQTNYVAMGMTTIYTDNQDLFKQKIEGQRYLVDNIWRELKIRKETILVKTGQGIKQQPLIVRQTFRGPIITSYKSQFGNYKINDNLSLCWTGFNDQVSSFAATLYIPQINDFQTAVNYITYGTKYIFNLNMIFMTKDGHIAYQQLGLYPKRPNNYAGNFIKDGTTTQNDWLGFVPPEDRLQLVDPECGYIITANNKIAQSQYYNGMHDYTMYTARSDRIHQLIQNHINSGKKITIGDMKEMQADRIDVYCRQILPLLTKISSQLATNLDNFYCNFIKSSSQATMYQVLFYELDDLIKPHQHKQMSTLSLHSTYQYLFNYIREASKGDTNKIQNIIKAWQKMKTNLSKFFQSSNNQQWRWGKYHLNNMHHLPFGATMLKHIYDRSFQGSGNMHTVDVGKMDKIGFGNFQVSHHANYRVIFSFVEESWWVIDGGTSEKVFSKHYDDQWKLYQANQYLKIDNKKQENILNDL